MSHPRLVLCGGASAPPGLNAGNRRIREFSVGGPRGQNVTIQWDDVVKNFEDNISDRLVDLLEIATYIFSADCSALRDRVWNDAAEPEPWDRSYEIVIPVRDVDFWTRADVTGRLVEILNFMSDDEYQFTFVKSTAPVQFQKHLDFGTQHDWPFSGIDRVTMFSGGLDSLAGVVDAASRGENCILVSHRPVPVMNRRQRELFKALSDKFPKKLFHAPVWVYKDKSIWREPTQRTRSFLFAALGAVVAASANAKGIRFYENGVISLNLPLAGEMLRARASRTTHPKSIFLLKEFLRMSSISRISRLITRSFLRRRLKLSP